MQDSNKTFEKNLFKLHARFEVLKVSAMISFTDKTDLSFPYIFEIGKEHVSI